MLDEGIRVRVDLILGLPGDTVDSVRRGLEYLDRVRPFTELQVFNLSILPGTAFRQTAVDLGLEYQPRPPYYVLKTPTLDLEDLYGLMEEAQDVFGIVFDALPPPEVDGMRDERLGMKDEGLGMRDAMQCACVVDLDAPVRAASPGSQSVFGVYALAAVGRFQCPRCGGGRSGAAGPGRQSAYDSASDPRAGRRSPAPDGRSAGSPLGGQP